MTTHYTSTTVPSQSSSPDGPGVRASYAPLQLTGILDRFKQFDNTPIVGTQFEDAQLKDWLDAENGDELIRDLAITVQRRNVVFFKNQDLSIEKQKELGRRLGKLSGGPSASTLHIHPVTEEASELGDEVGVIGDRLGGKRLKNPLRSQLASTLWHADITFEPVPSDFAILKIHTLPKTGGDTLWASAYEAYDRLTPAYQKFVEGLHAYHEGKFFKDVAKSYGTTIRTITRGNPENSGDQLEAIHPVVRTNPVTGWKGIFVNQGFTKYIVELSKDESDQVLRYLFRIVADNHDLQVRFKWSKNDVAIWSNTSSYHAATFDYEATRIGSRVVSIGERPRLDPTSTGRREALGLDPW